MGILANSASIEMTSSDPADTQAGFLLNEEIALTTNPAGTLHGWALARPAASGSAALDDDDAATAHFIPDVAGTYVATCNVDGTVFRLVMDVAQQSVSTVVEALRLPPRSDESVAAPTIGYALYNSSTQGSLAVKNSDGDVFTIELTPVP